MKEKKESRKKSPVPWKVIRTIWKIMLTAAFGAVVVFAGIEGSRFGYRLMRMENDGAGTAIVSLEVQEDDTVETIAEELKSQKLIESVFEFELQAKMFDVAPAAGTYTVTDAMSPRYILYLIGRKI